MYFFLHQIGCWKTEYCSISMLNYCNDLPYWVLSRYSLSIFNIKSDSHFFFILSNWLQIFIYLKRGKFLPPALSWEQLIYIFASSLSYSYIPGTQQPTFSGFHSSPQQPVPLRITDIKSMQPFLFSWGMGQGDSFASISLNSETAFLWN